MRRIRKTAEDPPRVAVDDVLQVVTGCSAHNCSNVFSRVSEAFPEVLTGCSNFKFLGRGQRETPVARTIVEIIMVLPGRAASQVRKAAADSPPHAPSRVLVTTLWQSRHKSSSGG